MKKHLKWASKCIFFCIILCIFLKLTYWIIVPKFFLNMTWPTTSTFLGFYEVEKNTIDVLFFGSSHAASSFVPQELYNNFGITSYNLGCEQQNLVTTYFWLEEALQYQKPMVVVLDCYMVFPYDVTEPLNTEESCTRKAFDFMRWSPVKMEAVKTICELDNNQSLLSYYFPNIRYHTRWTELSESDFSFGNILGGYELMGYAPLAERCGRREYEPFKAGVTEDKADMNLLMKEYLDKIEDLCRREGIQLLLVKTPTIAEGPEEYNTMREYADEHNLKFLDFNEENLYKQINYCLETDSHDGWHGNLWGAQKVTNYIGQELAESYGIVGGYDEQWEVAKDYYEGIRKDCELPYITDIDQYLAAIHDKRYSIFISANDDCAQYLKDSTIRKLKDLGLEVSLKEEFGCSYLAVITDGQVIEKMSYNKLELEGTIRNGLIMYNIVSAGSCCGNVSSIVIGKKEQSKNNKGLNIVVYNNETKKLVDSVCFETFAEENQAIR